MEIDREALTATFVELGKKLSSFGNNVQTREIIAQSEQDNSWFGDNDIRIAVEAIRETMLNENALREWLLPYPTVIIPRNVGVIMAGNIPLVGFFDMLCVLISGHSCYIKPSSKDSVLMEYIVSLLRNIAPNIAINNYTDQPLEAIIATGSNNTNRYFRERYGSLPAIFRGNRTSVAILSGDENREQLDGLASDIFSYSGLGCRSVSHLLVPENYDFEPLIIALSEYQQINPKYINNFRQRVATLKMNDEPFFRGAYFVLRHSQNLPEVISEITYANYTDNNEIREFISTNDNVLQSIVHGANDGAIDHPRTVEFGQTQAPSLTDYPDTADVMAFLAAL